MGGEGLWAKAQKNAVYHLVRYRALGNEADFTAFQDALAVPLGDHQARLELAQPDPDLDLVAQAFVAGRNHPEDAPGMARLFYRFGWFKPVREAIRMGSASRTTRFRACSRGSASWRRPRPAGSRGPGSDSRW